MSGGVSVMRVRSRFLDMQIDGSTVGCVNMLRHGARCFIRIASVNPANKSSRRTHPREGAMYSSMSSPR